MIQPIAKSVAGLNVLKKVVVCTMLNEQENAAIKTNSQFMDIYKGLVIRRGDKRAVVAIGHRVLKIIYSMLKSKSVYKDPEIDYKSMMVKKNAPRWIKALKKYGYVNKKGNRLNLSIKKSLLSFNFCFSWHNICSLSHNRSKAVCVCKTAQILINLFKF
jgi:hypothetical protein